jgi:hypothetical protein
LVEPLSVKAHDGLTELTGVIGPVRADHALGRTSLAVRLEDIRRALGRSTRTACASRRTTCATRRRFARPSRPARLSHVPARTNIHDTAIIIATRANQPTQAHYQRQS